MRTSIRTKLFAGFGAVLLLLVTVAGFGLLKLSEWNAVLKLIADQEVPLYGDASRMQDEFGKVQRDVRELVVVSDLEQIRALRVKADASASAFERLAR